MSTRATGRVLALAAAVSLAVAAATAAPAQQGNQAKIVGIVLSVKHRSGPTGTFVASKVGALLPAGSRVQTGARSKCALQFPNGAVIRMDERSDLVIQNASNTSTQLNSGQIWAKVIAGTTARVAGSSGVAVVKGTEWTFRDGAITCYDGAVSYETDDGATDVLAGYEGYIDAGGQVRLRPAPGRQYPGGDLIQWFGGVDGQASATPGSSAGTGRKDATLAIDPQIANSITPNLNEGAINVVIQGTDAAALSPRARVTDLAQATASAPRGRFPGIDPNTLAPAWASRPAMGWGGVDVGQARMGQSPQLPDRQYLFGPYTTTDAFAYVGDGGSSFGLRVRPRVIVGPVYVELGATTHASSWYGDGTSITEAFAAYRRDAGTLTVGRQRFLEGPVNNSRLGSLLTFDTGDAARVQVQLDRVSLDLAYVDKIAPVIGPADQGWYGRIQTPVAGGTIAANVVSSSNHNGTAFSVDLAIPAVEGQLDLYGEYGEDTASRKLYTMGAYFPQLYQSENLDLFVEYADREGVPGMASARAYKHFDDAVTGVLSVDKPSGDDLNFGAGVIWRFGD